MLPIWINGWACPLFLSLFLPVEKKQNMPKISKITEEETEQLTNIFCCMTKVLVITVKHFHFMTAAFCVVYTKEN